MDKISNEKNFDSIIQILFMLHDYKDPNHKKIAFSHDAKGIFAEGLTKETEINETVQTLFLLHDRIDDGAIFFSPQKAFEEITAIC